MRMPLLSWSCLSFPSWWQLLSGEDALLLSIPMGLPALYTMGCPIWHRGVSRLAPWGVPLCICSPFWPPEAGGQDQGTSQQRCPLPPALVVAGTGLADPFVYLWLLQALLGVKTIPGPPEADKIWLQGNTRHLFPLCNDPRAAGWRPGGTGDRREVTGDIC